MIHLAPGDPAELLAGPFAPPAEVEMIRQQFGLNKPLYVQLAIYLKNLVTGNFGYSYTYREPVLQVIARSVPATLYLFLTAFVFSFGLGILFGVLSAKNYRKLMDRLFTITGLILYSAPVFFVGIILVYYFGIIFRVFPTGGMLKPLGDKGTLGYASDFLRHLFLPALTLALFNFGQYLRMSRSSTLETMREDYVTTAKAVGFSERKIFGKYILKNAMPPIMTLAGIQIGYIFAGAILVEAVFSWPGLGTLILDAVLSKDYPLIMGSYVIIAVMVAISSLIIDLLYAWLDPRVTYR